MSDLVELVLAVATDLDAAHRKLDQAVAQADSAGIARLASRLSVLRARLTEIENDLVGERAKIGPRS